MHLLDGHVILIPDDLAQCEFALVRRVAELRGLLAPVEEQIFMGERVAALSREQQRRVVAEYKRKYARVFTEIEHEPAQSLAALRTQHRESLEELRSLRAVAGARLVVDVEPGVLLASSPTVVLAGTVADTVLERFARLGDIARLGGHAHAAGAATGREITHAFMHLNNDRRQEHSGPELRAVIAPRLARVASLAGAAASRDPWPWADPEILSCGFCAWCRAAADEHRDVQLVWGMRRPPREALRRAGITTIDELAAGEAPASFDAFSWSRFHERARLQLHFENSGRHAAAVHDPAALAALPEPSPGDIFFDFEGDPYWVEKNRFEWGLEFLFGFIEADTGEYTALWSGNQAEEKRAFEKFLRYLAERRSTHPGMHVYHFAFYEPATMRRLARRHRTGQKEVNALLEAGVFVDLYETVKSAIHTSGRSYGLKALEPLYMGEELRASDVTDGAHAVVAFERAVRAHARGDEATWQQIRDDLADYNRYDCESTRRLRDWLLALRQEPADDGTDVARDLLGASTLGSELLISPLEERGEDLSQVPLRIPGFDEPGIFYVSSGTSTDALGADHKVHELLGRWGAGSAFAPGQDVLVVYAEPGTGATDSTGLIARRAQILECGAAGDLHRIVLREATPAHDPDTQRLTPVHLDVGLPEVDATAVLKAAKRLSYSLITGPAGSGKSALARARAQGSGGAVVIDDAHQVSILDAVTAAGDAEHVIVVGDPARAVPIHRRALPTDLVHGPLLSWLQGDSGATIHNHTSLEETHRFHPELGSAIRAYLYPNGAILSPPASEVRLLPEQLTGLRILRVAHHGNRDTSGEEAEAIARLLEELFAASPLAESDVLVTTPFDAQALLLQRELSRWPGVRVLRLEETGGQEAALSIISLGTSTLADIPLGAARMPLAPHVLGAAITRAREAAFVVCSSHLLEQLPPRGAMFGDVARFIELVSTGAGMTTAGAPLG